MSMFLRFWKNTAMSLKLPVTIAVPAIVLLLVAGSVVTIRAVSEFSDEQRVAYRTLLNERANALETWLNDLNAEVGALALNGSVNLGIKDFGRGWMPVDGEEPSAYLRRLYVDENPNPSGQRDELLAAEDKSVWTLRHKKYHEGFRAYQQARNFHDMFLIGPNGNVIYSVFKESDFATNLLDGPYKDSGLGEAYRGARELESGQAFMSSLKGYGASNGAPAIFIAAPVYNGMSFAGVVAVQVPVTRMNEILAQSDLLGETGLVYMVDSNGIATSSSPHEGGHQVLEPLPTTEAISAAITGEQRYLPHTPGLEDGDVIAVTDSIRIPNGESWGAVLEINYDEATTHVTALIRNSLLTALGVSLGVLFFSWLAARTVTRRVEALNHDMHAVADGKYDTIIRGTDYGDEFGQITRTLEVFKGDLKVAEQAEQERQHKQAEQDEVVAQLSGGLVQLAKGNLTHEITTAFPEEHEKLRLDFNSAVSRLCLLVNEVIDAAQSIRAGALEINRSSGDLSQRTEAQAATLEETAAALDELTASVRSSAEGAQSVDGIVKEARSEADQSGTVVQNAVTAMTEIETSANQISQIIGVIDDIAFQTNLLALNAGVEAARAGEAGRGFAVVAAEVQTLAQRSANAASEIKALIQNSGEQVGRGVDLVGKAGQALESIVARVSHIASLISEIAEGAGEQSTGIAEINTGMSQLDQVTQQNAAMVEEATAASQLLNNDADKLADLVSRFETGRSDPHHREDMPVIKPTAHGDVWDTEDDIILPAAPAEAHDGNAARAIWQDF
ncbi:methyl-accepting chemotaxis protein [Phaeobacter sp. HF9A]|uniref:methyl-accepting chemotaxis protein n=1 Tax=Phaeobacter sp. HF9A TaxID=2721561 RepID=UPI00142F7E9A|nr:methyl-accepting chemotaxis protein [Phaeobacter sp. HF9A]NIZ12802.1 HAMP domain-containing protein [Phaeobacter sp. HF9A]